MTDTVDPLIAFLAENPPKDVFELRSVLDGFIASVNGSLPEIGESIDDVVIQSFDGQDLTVDVHRPKGEGPFPILVYLHGGGWVLGSPKTHRKLGYRFAERGFVVFNVRYRLAPEAPFPQRSMIVRLRLIGFSRMLANMVGMFPVLPWAATVPVET